MSNPARKPDKPLIRVSTRMLQPPFQQAPGAPSEAITTVDLVPAHLLDGGEIVIFAIKPSLWYVVFASARWLLTLSVVIALVGWLGVEWAPVSSATIVQAALLLGVGRICVAVLQWTSRLYVLTNRRIMRLRGIFNIDLFACPLTKIQETYLAMTWYERLAGVGTISFATVSTGGIEVSWVNVDHPRELHERVRSAIHRAQHGNGV